MRGSLRMIRRRRGSRDGWRVGVRRRRDEVRRVRSCENRTRRRDGLFSVGQPLLRLRWKLKDRPLNVPEPESNV